MTNGAGRSTSRSCRHPGPVRHLVGLTARRKLAERSVDARCAHQALDRYERPKPTLDGYVSLLEASS